jgi:hypothetical protein
MGIQNPTSPSVGDTGTAAWATEVSQDIQDISGSTMVQFLAYAPGGNVDSPTTGGQQVWFTVGAFLVPAWASKAVMITAINGFYTVGTTTNSSVLQWKLGTGTGSLNRRITSGDSLAERTNATHIDTISGLTSGSQSLTANVTWTSGSNWRLDVNSLVMSTLIFQR